VTVIELAGSLVLAGRGGKGKNFILESFYKGEGGGTRWGVTSRGGRKKKGLLQRLPTPIKKGPVGGLQGILFGKKVYFCQGGTLVLFKRGGGGSLLKIFRGGTHL